MVSHAEVQFKRLGSLFLFIIYDILQLYIIGHIGVSGKTNNIFRYSFTWESKYQLSNGSIIILLLIPILLSYLSAINNVTSSRGLVQIVGSKSLLHKVEIEFHIGNPDGLELNIENIKHYLENMAEGEPPGTIENLTMLLNMGIEARRVIQLSGVKSIKRVYVSDQNIPNAFTLRVIPLPFIGSDWIIINRNVVDLLEIEEIHAVIAHEIGHAERYDSWINSILGSPKLIIIFSWLVLFGKMLKIIILSEIDAFSILRVISLMLLLVLLRIVMSIGQTINEYSYRNAELLSDYYAAKLVGSDLLINALLKIGRRGEVLNSIKTEIEWLINRKRDINMDLLMVNVLNTMDPTEKSIEKARDYALKKYVTSTLSSTYLALNIQMDKNLFKKLVEESVSNLKIERGRMIRKDTVFIGLSEEHSREYQQKWKDVDINDDDYLDKNEIGLLVDKLKNSKKDLFENEVMENLGLLPKTPSHPKVKDRITFVFDTIISKEIDRGNDE